MGWETKSGRAKKEVFRRLRALPWFFLLFFFLSSCSPAPEEPQETTLLQRLRALPGLQVTQIQALGGFSQSFQIDITQPADHQAPASETFSQSFYLSHRDENAPMVFYTSGYGINRNFEPELSALLQANQILMVHRFFSGADLSDWTHLTIRQAADDQHQIRETLGGFYPGKWVSGGASKGGMTSLFYRRYYPDDVEATVAYVAPLMTMPDDPRFAPFFQQVGTAECRQKLIDFQGLVFARRETLIPLFRDYVQSRGYALNTILEEEAFEYTVLEYPFAFWQYGQESDCETIPGLEASDQQIIDHLVDVSSPYYYSDDGVLYFQPLFYQAYTEIGYCPYIYDHVQAYLEAVPQPTYRTFAPRNVDLVFRPEVMADMIAWLETQGRRIIYIYGGSDPWTAAALEPPAWLDALKVVQPGGNHSVKIGDLSQQDLVIQTLEKWLDVQIDPSSIWNWRAPGWRVRF